MGQPRQLAKFFVTINSLSIIKKIVTQDYCHSTSATCWLNSFFQCKHFQIVFNKNHKSFLYTWILTLWTFRGSSLITTIWTPWLLRRTSDTSRMGSSPGLLVSDWIYWFRTFYLNFSRAGIPRSWPDAHWEGISGGSGEDRDGQEAQRDQRERGAGQGQKMSESLWNKLE